MPTTKPRRIVTPSAEVIYLADRRKKDPQPGCVTETQQAIAAPADVVVVPFGVVTRSERMRQRRIGWGSAAIARVRLEDERRGGRK